MTAVTRDAEERLKLSSRISSSIRLSLTGLHVGWTTKMSEPRTFSSIWQKVSPSEKLKEETLPAVRFRYSQISCTSAGWARPPKIFSSPAIVPLCKRQPSRSRRERRGSTRDGVVDPYCLRIWLGREDSNLRVPDPKSGALPLGDAPVSGCFPSGRRLRTRA